MKDVRGAINEGRLIAICGVIGSGKTVMLRRLQQAMEEEKKDHRLQVAGHREAQHQTGHLHRRALLRPLLRESRCAFPTQGEKRERDLRELVRKNKRPVRPVRR
jgi:type II secretory pathway predicted ATPase ExeA